MQTTNALYDSLSTKEVRPLSWQFKVSFDKAFDPSVDFFIIGSSLLDSGDVFAPKDSNVVQAWDQYAYEDFSDRVVSMEVTHEEVEPYSVVRAFADVTLNNYDDYFTPNSGSPIDSYILPKRPSRILMGFGGQNLPQFIGLTDRMPEIVKSNRTARFHMVDFLSFLFSKKIENTDMLTDQSTGEILDYLFQSVGLLPDQLDFTSTSFNRIPFFFVEKDKTLGEVVKELMEAEQGRLFMSELGVITFLNRQDYSTTPTLTFDKGNTLDYRVSGEDDIINLVEITASALAEQQLQSIWSAVDRPVIKPGDTLEMWANLTYPVTSADDPVYSAKRTGSSHFISTLDLAGNSAYTDIDLVSMEVFSKSLKLTFENTGTFNGYIYSVDVWGTPVKEEDVIRVTDSDQTSIDNFDEQKYTLKTPYIQKKSAAISKAAIIIDDYKDIGDILVIKVVGNMALQIGDVVTLDLDGYDGEFVITKKEQSMQGGGYSMELTVKRKEVRAYFIIGESLLDGGEVFAP